MTIKNTTFTSQYPNRVKNKSRSLATVTLVLMLGLFLPITFGALTANAAGEDAPTISEDHIDPSAIIEGFDVLVSSIPTGTDNIDTPLTEYVTYNGRVDVAVGGKSFFETTTADDFDVDVPACSNGSKPIIHGAYIEWYFRWRGLETVTDPANNVPTFDPDLDIEFNGNGINAYTITEEYWARFDATLDREWFRRNALIDVTSQFDTDWTAGANNVSISGVVVPQPDSTDGDVTNSDIYGVGIHVFYECLEFDYAQVTFMTGLDWFYEVQDEPYAGDHSDLVCVSFPPVPAATTVDIDAIMSGQANILSETLRGGRLYSLSGSGAMPTVNSADPTGPASPVIDTGTQIRTGYTSIWTSSLGREWDEVVEPDAITLNAGDTWACIQAESIREPGSARQGISGDILGTGFSIPLPSPADWGDLPDGIYNTDSTGTEGPSHPIIPTLGIGDTVDAEDDGQPNATATGDDLNGDDEDGIVLPPAVKPGETAVFTATVTNETGQDAYLYGFVDWNGDGSFDGPGEVISITVPTGSVDVELPATFMVPAGAATDTDLGVRFRLSTDDDLGPDGPASDGEVEDYLYRLMSMAVPEYDLALIKRIASPGPFLVGDQVTFNILVMNQGNVDSGTYTVADTLPPELTFVSASPAATSDPGVGSTGVITWTGTNLVPNEIVTFTVTAEIASLPTGPIKNIAEITSDSGDDDDSDPTDNSDESDTENDDDVTNDKDDNDEDDSDFEEITVAEYDLALIKRLVSSGPYDIGTQVTFNILVMNQGGVNSGDYTVEDALPAELDFISANPAPATAPAVGSTGTVAWNSTNLAPGEITTFTITAEINTVPTAPIKNIAEITADSGDDDDSDPTDNSDESDTENDDDVTNDKDDNDQDDSDFEFIPVNEYDLALVKKVVTAGPYEVGQEITYQIEVMNQGEINSGDYTVEDNLPAELVFVSANPAPTTAPAVGDSGSITWDATDLAAGDITTFTVVVRIDAAPATGRTIKNTAEITADSGEDDDSDPTDDSDESDTVNDDDVTNDKDDNDQDDSDFEEIVLAEYDLALVKKVVTAGPYEVGQEITYQIEVMNQGEINSGDYTVEDNLPAELVFVSANPAPTTAPAVGASGSITWDATDLAAGDITTFTVVVRIDAAPATGRTIKNTAEITSDSGDDDDSDPTDDSDDSDTVNDDDVTNDQDDNDQDDSDFEEIVLAEYDLALVKKVVTAGPYEVGQEITYQIEVMNQGEINSGDYTVEDILPAEFTFVSANPAATTAPAVGSSGTITWDATNLAAGDIAVFTVVIRIDSAPALPGTPIKNTAEITADSGDDDDSDPTDDSGDSDTVNDDDVTNDQDDNDQDDSDFEEIVLGEYDLALIKEIVSTGPYTIGQEITYQITVMNQGELDSGEYKVADKLPPELTLVSVNPAATSAPPLGQSGTIEWTGNNLGPGEMAIYTIVAQIVSESQSIKNTAEITADSGDDDDSDPTDDSGDSDTINDDDVTNDKDDNDEDDSDFEIIQVPSPVPPSAVELISFTGMRTGNRQATLLWETASEIDHFGFRVLRSDNGRITDSQSVAWIPATIDSGVAPGNNYSLVDTVPGPGTYTYWLVDVDTNGVETIHGPVTVQIDRGWQIFLPIVSKQ